MSQEWDLTTRRRANKKLRIVKCPVCGRYGQVSIHLGHSRTPKFAGIVKHKGHVEMGAFNMIDVSCNLIEAQVVQIEKWLKGEK